MSISRFEGEVVRVAAAARGMGRSHAVRFTDEGADLIGVEIAPGRTTTIADPESTRRAVEERGGRALAMRADVRD